MATAPILPEAVDVIAARLRIRLPDDIWIADVSQANPSATFRLLSGIRAGATAVELGEVTTDDPATASDAIATHSSVTAYEELERTADRVLAKYETTDTALYEFVAESGLPIEYPVTAENGWYEFDLTGSRTEFDRFRAAIEDAGRQYELLSLVHSTEPSGILTERQRDVLMAALRAGYFELPRDCTLADVAATLDIDKSTASRVLRRGQTRIVKWFLTTAGTQSSQSPERR
ncbi:helix-turn-helix domain-containing protein [Haloarcula marismortui]|uniref:helix-turn-helix domain-containing protein n=1 Tax=Haloarcula marismortui TaxID=2238 RepID=UPI003C7104C9